VVGATYPVIGSHEVPFHHAAGPHDAAPDPAPELPTAGPLDPPLPTTGAIQPVCAEFATQPFAHWRDEPDPDPDPDPDVPPPVTGDCASGLLQELLDAS